MGLAEGRGQEKEWADSLGFLVLVDPNPWIDGVNITHAKAIWILGTFRTSIIVNN